PAAGAPPPRGAGPPATGVTANTTATATSPGATATLVATGTAGTTGPARWFTAPRSRRSRPPRLRRSPPRRCSLPLRSPMPRPRRLPFRRRSPRRRFPAPRLPAARLPAVPSLPRSSTRAERLSTMGTDSRAARTGSPACLHSSSTPSRRWRNLPRHVSPMPTPDSTPRNLLSGLPADLAERLFAKARPVRLAAGRALFAAGDPGTGCYRIDQGLLQVSAGSRPGLERILAIVGPRPLLGAPPRLHDG